MSLKVRDDDPPIVQPSTCFKNLQLNLKVHSVASKKRICVKRIYLVTNDGLFDRKAFYTVKNCFSFMLYNS